MFKIEMHFPSGRIEILEEDYDTLDAAIEGAERMLVQIEANNEYFKDKNKAHFYILKGKEEVYSSK